MAHRQGSSPGRDSVRRSRLGRPPGVLTPMTGIHHRTGLTAHPPPLDAEVPAQRAGCPGGVRLARLRWRLVRTPGFADEFPDRAGQVTSATRAPNVAGDDEAADRRRVGSPCLAVVTLPGVSRVSPNRDRV